MVQVGCHKISVEDLRRLAASVERALEGEDVVDLA